MPCTVDTVEVTLKTEPLMFCPIFKRLYNKSGEGKYENSEMSITFS